MENPSQRVCPDCGADAGSQPFCAHCGRNLTTVERLPTRAEWARHHGAPPLGDDVVQQDPGGYQRPSGLRTPDTPESPRRSPRQPPAPPPSAPENPVWLPPTADPPLAPPPTPPPAGPPATGQRSRACRRAATPRPAAEGLRCHWGYRVGAWIIDTASAVAVG